MFKWSLKGAPFEVQHMALSKSRGRKGYNWWLEQGLGKTPVCFEGYSELQYLGLVDHLIVVCPNSLKGNWVSEAKKWNADVQFQVWENPKDWNPKHVGNATVINYEALMGAGGEEITKLLTSRRCFLALDEAQRIKNPSSAVTKVVLGQYSKLASYKRGLTGTPMTNTVADLWSQLRFAGALNGTNVVPFTKRYGVTISGFKGKKKVVGTRHEEELREIIEEYGFRASKADWSDLPEKLYRDPISVPMPNVLRAHYQTMLEEFVVMLDVGGEDTVSAIQVAGQYLKLQQISSGFIYGNNREVHRLTDTKSLPKFKALMDVIDANGSSSKTLVFVHFRPSCQELITCIGEMTKQPVAYIVGGMTTSEIDHQKDIFNSSSGPQVMVLQLSAGKEGHTLLGDPDLNPCHTVCYYENNFNLVDRAQSEDRPHRYGQKNAILYVDFASSPMERLIIQAYQRKKKIIDFLIDNRGTVDKAGDEC
jgi:SNF2 family DNA or RNA helicase